MPSEALNPVDRAPRRDRLRAMDDASKQARADAILVAAEQLLLRFPNRLPNVDEVAHEAGLAKGTVYLYFQSKEHLLLALHQSQSQAFFEKLLAELQTCDSITVPALVEFTRRNLWSNPLYMPLAMICMAAMQKALPVDVVDRHAEIIGTWVMRAGHELERHFPQLPPGEGARLLNASYALMIGLWQIYQPDAATLRCSIAGLGHETDFGTEAEFALQALWRGRLVDAESKGE